MAIEKTVAAFAAIRERLGHAQPPDPIRIANDDEVIPLSPEEGLEAWEDGPDRWEIIKPLPNTTSTAAIHLWVVRQEDVVYAAENCEFGRRLETGVIKHTNLTGGAPAFVGGEVMFFEGQTIVINGKSARYPVASSADLDAIALAFKRSGYTVWSMGFDEEAGRPFPFIGVEPKLVA